MPMPEVSCEKNSDNTYTLNISLGNMQASDSANLYICREDIGGKLLGVDVKAADIPKEVTATVSYADVKKYIYGTKI